MALDLEEYFIKMIEDGYAPNTISGHFKSIEGLYRRLHERFELIEKNPFESLSRKDFVNGDSRKHDASKIVYITADEKEAMCDHALPPPYVTVLIGLCRDSPPV